MNGNGPAGGDAVTSNVCRSGGGRGFGAGGAGGYWYSQHRYAGGNGADGLVYVEW